MKRAVDIVGQKFGKLLVLEYIKTENNKAFWLCKCECGIEKIIKGTYLRRGYTKSCGCLLKEQKKNVDKCLELFEASKNRLYRSYKYNAKTRNVNFELTKEEFLSLISQNCFYCGKIPEQQQNDTHCNGNYTYNGIDRIDNSIGYTHDNCVPCCKMCNFSKSKYSKEEFLNWIERVYKYSIKKG